MQPLRRQTLVAQTAQHLREGFRTGQWSGHLPGVRRLATDLAVSKDTIRAALQLLEKDGALKASEAGKRRRIVASRHTRKASRRTLRVALLLNEPLENDNSHSQQLFLLLQHSIESAGHVCFFTDRCLTQLAHKPQRVARLVKATRADAWIIYAGTHEVLAWFARRQIPTLAVGGRVMDLPIACTRADIAGTTESAVDTLINCGHRRIVMICSRQWRHPTPNPPAAAFLSRLKHHGVPAGDYNLPEWQETAEGFQKLLAALFFATPPTALLLADPSYTAATVAFLAQRSMQVPRDVSLVSMLSDPVFAMCRPIVAHFVWPMNEHIRRATRWVESVLTGKADHGTMSYPAKFDLGGTIAPVK